MGEVFLARKGGETLVIKRILPRLAAQQAFLDRFLHEARVVARLNDPTISRIYELGDVEGQWFIAMEYVEGQSLQALLARGPLSLGAACRVGLEAATALSVAHGARDAAGRLTPVVHRDVSPHNLLVGSSGAVKLIDFGVASLTGQGETGGKLAYSAPEQLLEDVTDARSDQYSLGVVLWECLAHRQAFDADADVEVIRQVTEVGVPALPDSVPAGLREVVTMMTALEPAARFADVATARAALLSAVRALKLDVSPAALIEEGRVFPLPAQRGEGQGEGPIGTRTTPAHVSLDAIEQQALALIRDGMSVEEAEAAIDAAALPGAPFALDLLQALIEKGALRSEDQGGGRRLKR